MAASRDVRAPFPGRWAPRLAWLLWALALSGLAAALWLDHLLRQAGRSSWRSAPTSCPSWRR